MTGLNLKPLPVACTLKAIIKSRHSDYTAMEFLVVTSVSNKISKVKLELPKGILPESCLLANPQFFKPCHIDVITGVELFYEIILNQKIELIPNQ
jgi:hypothetical protein